MSETVTTSTHDEIVRLRRTADLLSTAHASMSDSYGRRALGIDLIILISSAWLTALAFVDPRFNKWLVPNSIDPVLWTGLLGLLTFCLTLIQLKTDWRGLSEAHKRTFTMYVEVKREAGYLLANPETGSMREFQRLAARYDMASEVGKGIPERKFLKLKKKHKSKVEISKILDERPGAFIPLLRLGHAFRDNWPQNRK